MFRYTFLVNFTILLLIVDLSWAAVGVEDERIAALEELIKLNDEKLLVLEAKVKADKPEESKQTELCCETHIKEQQTWLSACQTQMQEAEIKLKAKEEQITKLTTNLTICQVNSIDEEYQSDSESELKKQLQLKDQQMLELKTLNSEYLLQLKAARSKLQAYDKQFEEFHPGSCLPFGSTTGIYRIKLPDLDSFYVPCDARLAGSGWLVIQRRMDGSVNFYRNWTDYQEGFGALNGEFFLGLDKLHRLTSLQSYELYVHLEDFEGDIRFAHYDNFSVGSEETNYELSSLGRYDGTAGNSMGLNVLQQFSTLDNDNDSWLEGSCARRYHSAWWYASCAAFCNPNGKYFKHRQLDSSSRGKGIIWQHWHGFEEALKFVQLMIRPISTANY